MIPDHTIRFEHIYVSLLQLKVYLGAREIHFTLSELRLLLVFLQEPYRTFTSDELVHCLDLTNRAAVHQLVSRIRALLGQQYIHTDSDGYAFAQKGRLRIERETV